LPSGTDDRWYGRWRVAYPPPLTLAISLREYQ